MLKTISTISTVSMFTLALAVPALAQDTPAKPATPQPEMQLEQTAPQTTPDATTPAPAEQMAPDTKMPPDTAAAPEQTFPEYVSTQTEDQLLSTDLVGATVYDSQDDDIGDINNLLIMQESGQTMAAVIGVGGFLGIGEKLVAVGFDRLQISMDENGNRKITLDATREELESAPEFKSLADAESNAQTGTEMPTPAPQ